MLVGKANTKRGERQQVNFVLSKKLIFSNANIAMIWLKQL
jgi:hypothetical protein